MVGPHALPVKGAAHYATLVAVTPVSPMPIC
jgi:hypothetical protein